MPLPEDSLYYVLFFLSPFLALISAVFVGYLVYEIISFLKNNILTRLLKVILVPVAFFLYVVNYINQVFDFDHWFDSFLSGGGWETLSSGDKFLIAGPIMIGILFAALKYVIGWDSNTVVEETPDALDESEEPVKKMEITAKIAGDAGESRDDYFEQGQKEKPEQA